MTDTNSSLPSIETRSLIIAKRLKFCRNGDPNFGAKTITYNSKQTPGLDSLMQQLTFTVKTRSGRPVNKIYSARSGRRMNDAEELEPGKVYACAGTEAFVPLGYTSIESPTRKHSKNSKSNLFNNIEPVRHSNIRQESRYKVEQEKRTNSMRIRVAINKHNIEGAHCILIPYVKMQGPLDEIIEYVAKELNEGRDGPKTRVEHLYYYAGEKWRRLRQPSEIDADKLYVACDPFSKLQELDYKVDGYKNFSTMSPRYVPRPGFLGEKLERSQLTDRDNKRPRTLPPVGGKKGYYGSPDNSVASNPEYKRRQNKTNGSIHTKPKTHKRTPEKKTIRQVDYDRDDGGVFKAKTGQKETKGAKEVNESRETRTDLPIDQVQAEEVQEETFSDEENTAKVPSEMTLSRRQSEQEDQDIFSEVYDEIEKEEEKIKNQQKGKDTTHKTNSKTNPEPSNKTNSKTRETTQKTNSKTNQKEADHSHGAKQQPKHSGTRGEFNNVSPLPPIESKNNNARASTPKNNRFDSPTGWSDDGRDSATMEEKAQAATKIQANFRGHKTRQELAKAQAGQKSGNKKEDESIRKQNEEKKKKEQEDDQRKKEDEAATKIQAGFRGHKTRQELQKQKEEEQVMVDVKNTSFSAGKEKKTVKDEMDEEEAATKIQANFRGHKTRQELAMKKEEEEMNQAATKIQANYRGHKVRKELDEKKTINQNYSSPTEEEEQAATKIQANFRGHQTRKQLQEQADKANAQQDQNAPSSQNKTPQPSQGGQTLPKKDTDISVLQDDPSKPKGNTTPSVGGTDPAKAQGGTDPAKAQGSTDPSKAQGSTDPSKAQGGTDPSKAQGSTDPSKAQGGTDPSKAQGSADPSKTQGTNDPSKTKIDDDDDDDSLK